MALVSTTKILKANIDWDETWAKRPNSGSGIKWRISPNSGVTINDPTKQTITATFMNPGTYTAYLGVTDGAMPAYASKQFKVDEGELDLVIDDDEDFTVPVQVTLPVGQAVYNKLDCVIAIDTSGSMSSEINQAKSKAEEIVNALRTGSGDVACCAKPYANYNQYPYAGATLATTLDGIKSQINAINLDGGASEAHFCAISQLCNYVNWRASSLRVFIQFTDEPGSEDTYMTPSDALSALNAHNVHYIHIWCDSSGIPSEFTGLANSTGGAYYGLGDGAAAIVQSLKDALDNMSKNLTVELVTGDGTGQGLVKSISPSKHYGISPGDTFSFNITFNRRGLPPGSGTQTFRFNLNVRTASDLALLETIPVNVTVSWT